MRSRRECSAGRGRRTGWRRGRRRLLRRLFRRARRQDDGDEHDPGQSFHSTQPLLLHASGSISRILYPETRAAAARRNRGGGHLSRASVACRLQQPTRRSNETGRLSLLLGLAPDGGCLAAPVTRGAGRLLPYLFTLAGLNPAVCFCGPVRGSPRLGVTQHRALRSPDFPRPKPATGRFRPRPPNPLALHSS